MTATDLLDGAIDLHRHGSPELSNRLRNPVSDADDITACRDHGMVAVVLKSHLWPTVGRAELLSHAVPGIDVVPSVTLNAGVGGMSPAMLELAAQQGARMVFFPTWSSHHDHERGGISSTMLALLEGSPAGAASLSALPSVPILDTGGRLRPEVVDCLHVAREHDMLVSTGHISPTEALAVAESGLAAGRLVFAHPDSHSVGATWEEARRIADAGAIVEITALGLAPEIDRTTPAALADLVSTVGADRCVLTSDWFFDWAPASWQMLSGLADALIGAGIVESDVRRMLVDTPRRLLGMPVAGSNDHTSATDAAVETMGARR